MSEENMKLWNAVCTTAPSDTKKVNSRGGFTSICAQSQIRAATEQWGPYGTDWGMGELQFDEIRNAAGELVEVTLLAMFVYPGGSFQIAADASYRAGNDTRKKLLTDATTKALSKLGFNADVFLGMYDDNKYVQEQMQLERQNAQPQPQQAPTEPQPPQKSALDQRKEVLFATWPIADIERVLFTLINPDTNNHFVKGERITRMAELAELERQLNAGVE
jgi:hypothetical protein